MKTKAPLIINKPKPVEKNEAVIVGGGLTGPLLGVYLAKLGFSIDLYERRPDLRKTDLSGQRSINLAISVRGLAALREIGLEKEILQKAIPMHGRMVHALDGTKTFLPYGRKESDAIHSLSRSYLNKRLLDEVEKFPNVRTHFSKKIIGYDLNRRRLKIEDSTNGKIEDRKTRLCFGTDGQSSLLRDELVKNLSGLDTLNLFSGNSQHHHSSSDSNEEIDSVDEQENAEENEQEKEIFAFYSKEDLTHSYKELTIPPGPQGSFLLEKHALHIWPRGSFMLIALPNIDGSFTCTLFLETEKNPEEGPSFASLKTATDVQAFFQKVFPDVLSLIPNLNRAFFQNPLGVLSTLKCYPWGHKDQFLLLGDASHAIVPFYGQGMNCCFEDCSLLYHLMADKNSQRPRKTLFLEFQKNRRLDTDAISDMAKENFIEMRDHTGTPAFILRKGIEQTLAKDFPDLYFSQYYLVTFTSVPYSYAQKVGKYQENMLAELGRGLTHASELSKDKISLAMKKYQVFLRSLASEYPQLKHQEVPHHP